MRRKDREVSDPEAIRAILRRGKTSRLALFDGDFPYIVPMHYGFRFENGRLTFYMHGASTGHKIDLIRRNPNVCVEVDDGARLLSGGETACRYGAAYSSVVARGKATILDEPREKREGLNLLMENQTGRRFEFDAREVAAVAVVKVDVSEYSAKSRSESLEESSRRSENGDDAMPIRRAEAKDVDGVLALLSQVLELHAKIRPDIFIPGTTKYSRDELVAMFQDERRPVFVAVDAADEVVGYAFCAFREQPFSNNMVPFESLFIDDLCVDSQSRGRHVGRNLFERVKSEAIKAGCYEVTLNVWEGNDAALGFYKRMGLKPKETQMEYILKERS